MVSLEPQSIPGDIWILIFENIVFTQVKRNLEEMVVFVGRGLLGADGSP